MSHQYEYDPDWDNKERRESANIDALRYDDVVCDAIMSLWPLRGEPCVRGTLRTTLRCLRRLRTR